MKTMLTLKQAVEYLREQRGIAISRQTLYTYAQRHATQCQVIQGAERPVLFLIPTTLLDTFTFSAQHQAAGATPKTKKKAA